MRQSKRCSHAILGVLGGYIASQIFAAPSLHTVLGRAILLMGLTAAAFVSTIARDISVPTFGTGVHVSLLYHMEDYHLKSLFALPLPGNSSAEVHREHHEKAALSLFSMCSFFFCALVARGARWLLSGLFMLL